MVGLVRVGRQLVECLAVHHLHGVELCAERGLGVVERVDDGTLQVCQRDVEVGHQRVLLAAVGHEVVALQQLLVVGSNLRLHGGVADTRAGGQQLVGMRGVGDVVAHVAHHIQLVADELSLLVGCTLLAHGLGGHRFHAGHGVGALVSGNVLVYIAQLLLNHCQSLLDKFVGRYADLVAVCHPVLVVDVDDGLQDVVGLSDGVVGALNVDDVLCLWFQAGRDEAAVVLRGLHKPHSLHQYLLAHLFLIVERGLQQHLADGCLRGVVHVDVEGPG